MIVAFRISSMGFGGAERVFISVADYLAREHKFEIHFVVDRVGVGETEQIALDRGYKLIGLDSSRTMRSILPLMRYIDFYKPDVLISAYTDTNIASIISAKIASFKTVVISTEHASLDEHWQFQPAKRRFLLDMYVRFGYLLSDHVLAVSAGIVRQINERLGKPAKVSCIHNPVRFKLRAPSDIHQRSECIQLLAVGRITKQKDYITLLKSFGLVISRINARLIIVGGVHEPAEKVIIDKFIDDNNLTNHVQFVGFTDEVEKYYRSSDIFVLSSAWEGFGNVLVEALAFGLPVVSTDCNHGPSEILDNGKYGRLVPVGDFEALAESIVASVDDIGVSVDLRKSRAEEFSEDRIGLRYFELINRLCANDLR